MFGEKSGAKANDHENDRLQELEKLETFLTLYVGNVLSPSRRMEAICATEEFILVLTLR